MFVRKPAGAWVMFVGNDSVVQRFAAAEWNQRTRHAEQIVAILKQNAPGRNASSLTS